jgi:galactitol-specific phosphotransferase system IIB component
MPLNPTNTISGNGVPGQVTASYSTGSSSWNIISQNLPGQVLTGTFPNSFNTAGITNQNYNFTWPFRGGRNYPNIFPRTTIPAGIVGMSSVGIVLQGPRSGITVLGTSGSVFNINSISANIRGEDIYGGKTTLSGSYHYQDNGFIKNNAWGSVSTSTWTSGFTHADGHSKIIGWSRDGYPIYGPYGYTDPLDDTSSVARLESGYQISLRGDRPIGRAIVLNGSVVSATNFVVYSASGVTPGMTVTGTGVPTGTKIISITGLSIRINVPVTIGSGAILTTSYPPGIFVEDFIYLPSSVDSLDLHNGRYCVTPDFPDGTYAYFLTEDSQGNSVYPYIIGNTFYSSTSIDSTDSTLVSLITNRGNVLPNFTSTVTNYTIDVANTFTNIRYTVIKGNVNSVAVLNSTTLSSGVISPPVTLAVGLNVSTIRVTSEYFTTSTYTVVVNRLRKSINTLDSLTVLEGPLTPGFDSAVNTYSITVDTSVTLLNVVPVRTDADSTVVVSDTNLSFGINVITVTVTAENGSVRVYTINATRLSNVTLLSDLEINGVTISGFTGTQYLYSANFPNSQNSITITATAIDSLAEIYINGQQFNSGQVSNLINLNPGSNPISVRVVSSDLTNTQFYKIIIVRQFSSVANLISLNLSSNNQPLLLTPAFNQNVVSYSASVANTVTSISVIGILAESTGRLTINNLPVSSGTSTQVSNLLVGSNFVNVNVTAPDQTTTKLYSVNVTRAPSTVSILSNLFAYNTVIDPIFQSNVFLYNETVGYDTETTTIVPTAASSAATITVNGVSVISGTESQTVPLTVGLNSIVIVVTAEDNVSQSTYQLNLTRRRNYDSQLIALDVNVGALSPEFNKNIFDYSTEVSFSILTAEITPYTSDVNASAIYINNQLTTASGVTTTVNLGGSILNKTWMGTTTFAIVVVADDEENTSTYNLSITRRPSTDSLLSSLSITTSTLIPSFNSQAFEYFLPVSFNTTEIGLQPRPRYELANAVYQGNELSTSSFTMFPLYVGINPIAIQCVAADGVASSTYVINVQRASSGLSTNSLLSLLEVNYGSVTKNLNSNIINHTIDVPYEIQTIKVRAIKEESNAVITVNGVVLISGNFSNNIVVPPGNSLITVRVTAQDNATFSDYRINVNRVGSTDSKLKDLYVSSGQLDKNFNKDVTQYSVIVKNIISSVSLRPIVNDSQSEIYVDNLFVPVGSWSQPVDIDVGENIIDVLINAGDRFNRTVYQIKFIRESYGIVDPAELFLIDGTGNISASYVDNSLLRIFTKVNTGYVNFQTFNNAPSLQNLEVVYPYRGGRNESAFVKPLRTNNSMLGITFAGIPLYDPSAGITVNGANSSTWTIDAVRTTVPESDQYGGYITETGLYNYKSNLFTKTDSWKNKESWFGDMVHADGHSRIVGFSADGYPIYGPYGYSNPVSSFSSVIEMISGYSIRNNSANRPADTAITYTGNALGNSIELSSSTHANVKIGMHIRGTNLSTLTNYIVKAVSTNSFYITLNQPVSLGPFGYNLVAVYPPGAFIEDNFYDVSKTATLDRHNGRYCVTPEYPFGTYAYFATGVATETYPYIIGNSFYGALSNELPGVKAIPRWTTNAGFITTATENIAFSRSLLAIGPSVSYKLISGDLPEGLRLNTSTGIVSGTPSLVWQTTESEFVVRAQNQYGVTDRTFRIDVRGATPPAIVTFGPRFAIGPSGENYIVNGQYVDFQFTAIADIVPEGRSVFFYIEEDDGILPPGLTLTANGRLYGQVLDDLALPYQAGTDGRYDAENYDSAPYEHESQQEFGIRGRYINKTYRFFLSASNGPSSIKAEYIIDVRDPASLVDTNQYPVVPQWISSSNLGTVISNSSFIYNLETYDCDQGGGNVLYEWSDANGGNTTVLPPGLILDATTGIIHGNIGYTPVHTTTYSFKIRVYKNNIITNTLRFRERTFNLTVLGTVRSGITFESKYLLGTLYQGEQSELQVLAVQKDNTSNIVYSLQSGNLPPGLSLASDGAIQGRVNYNSTQTSIVNYNCVIKATDSALSSVLGNFQIAVNPYEGNKFTKILMKPLLSLETRQLFDNFISNQNIFDSTIMYRSLDPEFNIRKNVEFVLEHAIEERFVEEYVDEMQNYFYRKKLQFGDVKSAFALDENHNKLYEVIYVELIDNLVNLETGKSVSFTIDTTEGTMYPNSIDNMRAVLASKFKTDNYLQPKFMKTVQDSSGLSLGRILCMPLCYCLPGMSKSVINKINSSEFDFKKIHFDIDRLIVQSTLDNSTAKYLLFPKREV